MGAAGDVPVDAAERDPSEPEATADGATVAVDDGDPVDRDGRLRRWFFGVWLAIGIGVLLWAGWHVLSEPLGIVFAPLALAAVIVYLLNPVVRWLHGRGVPRSLGALAAYLVVLGGLVGLGFALGPLLGDQVRQFIDGLPEILQDVQTVINDQLARFNVDPQFHVNLDPDRLQDSVRDWLVENRQQVETLLRGAGAVVTTAFHALLTLILAPILAFYLLVDLPRLTEGLKRLVPPGPRTEVIDVAQRIGGTVGAYFRGQLLVATFVGIATSIGLAVVGLPFWALVGALTGLFNLIPLIGPFVGGVIGVIIALTVGDGFGQAVWVVIVMTAVQQIDNHVITPNIISRTVKVHPVTVVLGLLVAGSIYGILGMLVVIPLIAAVKLVFLHVMVTRVPSMRHLAAEGPGLFGTDLPQVRGAPSASQAEAEMPDELRPEPPLTERLRQRRDEPDDEAEPPSRRRGRR